MGMIMIISLMLIVSEYIKLLEMSERQVGGTLKNNEGEKFMKKKERQICWAAKDKLFACMRKHDENETNVSKCKDLRNDYKNVCPPTWVTHFDRKFHYENYKKRLYSDGFEAHDKKFQDDTKSK